MRRRGLAGWLAPFLGAFALCGAAAAASAGSGTNVPDAVTRKSGLRLAPMSRPSQLYAANCQGCHGERGVSVPEIPPLAGRIGYFVRVPAGRDYLLQVPNVALNPSSDEAIAEMMNWVLITFSSAQMPADFQPYTAQEVGRLRRARIDVRARRRQIVDQLVALHEIPSADVLAISPSSAY
jgi:mono/diheme cytochrome c family protein